MKDTVRVYLGKIAKQLDNLLNCPSAERTIERKEPTQGSLQSDSSRPEQQASHQSGRLADKRKERRKSFIALAFVLLFASLCGISLLGQKSASAVAAHSSSATLHHSASTSLNHLDTGQGTPVDCTNPANISDNSCYGGGDPIKGTPSAGKNILGSDCKNHYSTANNNTLCWNDNDFGWGARDITCVVNKDLNTQRDNFNADHPGVNFGTGMTLNTSGSPTANPPNGPSAQFYNQNSCVDASTCYSNDASRHDDSGSIHAQIGGDDITCYNNACIGDSTGNTSAGGDCGAGLPYDKFGCSPIPNLDKWYYNPTAYNPFGAVEQVNDSLNINDPFHMEADSHITCNSSNQWSCPSGDAVVLLGGRDRTGKDAPFTHDSPEEILPTYKVPDPRNGGWAYPPGYAVFCSNTGSDWFFPCSNIGYSASSEGTIDEGMLQTDWLSGDGGTVKGSGHLAVTYLDDTVSQPNVQALFSLMLGLGYMLLTPVLFLIGYQMLWASWTLGRAAIMEAFGHLLLSIIALAVSWELASTATHK